MSFNYIQTEVELDGKKFAAGQETNTGLHYFNERITSVGILNFGFVRQNDEAQISLADNGITSPILIDSIHAFSPENISDEIYFYLYTTYNGQKIKLGTQKYTNDEMPVNYSTNIVFPDMVIGVKPTRANSTIILYAKPVNQLFEAVPNPS